MSGYGNLDTQELLQNSLGRPGEPNSRLFQINWRAREVLMGLAVLVGWRLLMIDRSWWPESLPRVVTFFLTAGFPALWMILYPVLVARSRGVRDLFSEVNSRRVTKEFLLTLPVALLLMAAMAATSTALIEFGGRPLGTPQQTGARGDVIALLVLSVVLTPLAEELFFRGLVYNFFRRQSPVWIAILTQAGLFAILHAYSPIRMTVVFLLGICFGLVYQWRKTLVAPMIIHTLLNLLWAGGTILVLLVHLSTPYLGIRGEAAGGGYVVEAVAPGGPADKAGLLPGDRIVAIDGSQIGDDDQGTSLMSQYEPEAAVQIDIVRGGQLQRVEAVLERKPAK